MKLISHRGNVDGKNILLENSESYIVRAITLGYDVEIDVWVNSNIIYLGHDSPQYRSSLTFILKYREKLWCHAKNFEALTLLLKNDLHCFFHNTDDYTITSKGFIWAYTGKHISNDHPCISVMPENNENKYSSGIYGICSDVISHYS